MTATMSTHSERSNDRTAPYFPVAGIARDGYTTATESTATCFCGSVQLAFPITKPGLVDTFLCHCTDCHKITASMFASNFVVQNTSLRHLRGQSTLRTWSNSSTIITKGNTMVNHFCGTCGTLMYRVGTGFPGVSILRIGTADDFGLMEGVLRPRVEQFEKDRVGWLGGAEGVRHVWGYAYGDDKEGQEEKGEGSENKEDKEGK